MIGAVICPKKFSNVTLVNQLFYNVRQILLSPFNI